MISQATKEKLEEAASKKRLSEAVSAEVNPYTKAEQQHYEKIRNMEIHVSSLESKWLNLKEKASDAKKAFEGAESELRASIREGAGQMTLPGMADSQQPVEDDKDSQKSGEGETENPPPPSSDSWKSLLMVEVGVTGPQARLFEEAGIKTLGDFAELGQREGENWYKEIPGIGKGKADKIEDLLDVFWADHPEFSDEPPVDAPREDEGDENFEEDDLDAGGDEDPDEEDPDEEDPNDDDDDDIFEDEDDEEDDRDED